MHVCVNVTCAGARVYAHMWIHMQMYSHAHAELLCASSSCECQPWMRVKWRENRSTEKLHILIGTKMCRLGDDPGGKFAPGVKRFGRKERGRERRGDLTG